jgi:hypothetical protein
VVIELVSFVSVLLVLLLACGLGIRALRRRVAGQQHADDGDLLGQDQDGVSRRCGGFRLRIPLGAHGHGLEFNEQIPRRRQVLA